MLVIILLVVGLSYLQTYWSWQVLIQNKLKIIALTTKAYVCVVFYLWFIKLFTICPMNGIIKFIQNIEFISYSHINLNC